MNSFSSKSLGFRMLSSFIIIIVAVLSVYTVYAIYREEQKARRELASKGELMVNLLANSARIGVFAENSDLLKNIALGFAAQPDVVLVGIYNAQMKPLYLSNKTLANSSTFLIKTGTESAATKEKEKTTFRDAGRTLEF